MHFVVFAQRVGVEEMDECAAVIARLEDAVVFELDQGLLHRHLAQTECRSDLVAVHAITGPQPATEKQVEHMRDDLIFFFDALAFGQRLSAPFRTRNCGNPAGFRRRISPNRP